MHIIRLAELMSKVGYMGYTETSQIDMNCKQDPRILFGCSDFSLMLENAKWFKSIKLSRDDTIHKNQSKNTQKLVQHAFILRYGEYWKHRMFKANH